MGRKFPNDFECAECADILRALLNDFHVDHREVRRRLRHMHGWARVFGRQPFGGPLPGRN